MASYIFPPVYAAFIWWFSTGAVLLLVGLSNRLKGWKFISAAGLLGTSLYGLAISGGDASVNGAYTAFTATILLWGAQEIVFLAGWVTGPRPVSCPEGVRGSQRLSLALQAILYHEFMLIACGAAVVLLTWDHPNQIGLWTFVTLWVLRQSAKINLFLGVPVTNDELMPDAVCFLKSFFARRSVGVFFPLSITVATAVFVIMVQRLVEVATTPFEISGLTLVSTLFALGVVEHWFMLLPLPAMKLWGWGVKSRLPNSSADRSSSVGVSAAAIDPANSTLQELSVAAPGKTFTPQVVELSAVRRDPLKPISQQMCARERLEEQFRQTFLEQHERNDLKSARLSEGGVSAVTVNGRTS